MTLGYAVLARTGPLAKFSSLVTEYGWVLPAAAGLGLMLVAGVGSRWRASWTCTPDRRSRRSPPPQWSVPTSPTADAYATILEAAGPPGLAWFGASDYCAFTLDDRVSAMPRTQINLREATNGLFP